MVQKVNVITTSDLSGEEGAETLRFSVNLSAYEIDLTGPERKQFEEAIAPYRDKARSAGMARSSGTVAARYGKNTAAGGRRKPRDRKRATAVRTWAKERGYQISERGRVPAQIIAEYDADMASRHASAAVV